MKERVRCNLVVGRHKNPRAAILGCIGMFESYRIFMAILSYSALEGLKLIHVNAIKLLHDYCVNLI